MIFVNKKNKFFINFQLNNGAVPKVMSVALIELVEMTATLNVVVSINSTTVMQTYWTATRLFKKLSHIAVQTFRKPFIYFFYD